MEEPTGKATPHNDLIAEIMDCRVAKNEREWAASKEIAELKELIKVYNNNMCNADADAIEEMLDDVELGFDDCDTVTRDNIEYYAKQLRLAKE